MDDLAGIMEGASTGEEPDAAADTQNGVAQDGTQQVAPLQMAQFTEQFRQMQETMNAMAAQNQALMQQLQTFKQKGPEQEPTTPDFVGKMEMGDWESLLESPTKFGDFLRTTINKAVAAANEQVLRTVPAVAAETAQHQEGLRRYAAQFYTQNKDLVPYAPVIGAYVTQLQQQNPGWDINTLVSQAAQKVRTAPFYKVAADPSPKSSVTPQTTTKPKQQGGTKVADLFAALSVAPTKK